MKFEKIRRGQIWWVPSSDGYIFVNSVNKKTKKAHIWYEGPTYYFYSRFDELSFTHFRNMGFILLDML